MALKNGLFAALLAASLIGLAGCDVPPPAPPTSPTPRPVALGPTVSPQSEISRQMAKHLARVQADLLVQGLLRTDGGGPDVPFSKRNLVDNFIRIALFDEYTNTGGQIIARETKSRLRRWEQPIRMQIEFGPSVPLAQRSKDRDQISQYIKRLSRLTGVPIRLTNHNPNYNVLILNEDERQGSAARLQALAPGIGAASLRTVTDMSRETLCLVFTYSNAANQSQAMPKPWRLFAASILIYYVYPAFTRNWRRGWGWPMTALPRGPRFLMMTRSSASSHTTMSCCCKCFMIAACSRE